MERLRPALILAAAFVGGLVAGLLGTVIQQAVWYIGGVPIPWGIVLALGLVTVYLLGLRWVNESRWPATVGLIGVGLAMVIFVGETVGGSILVPSNLLGNIWSIAPALIGIGVVAWPRLQRRSKAPAN